MITRNEYLVALAVAILFIFRRTTRRKPLQQREDNIQWAQLDMVGTSSRTRLSFSGAVLKSLVSTHILVNDGYQRFNKALRKPFALPTTWTRSGTLIVLPPSLVPMLARPDKTRDAEWTSLQGMVETIQVPYIIRDASIYQNVLQFGVVRRKMQSRDVGQLAPVTAGAVSRAFGDIWGTEATWRIMNAWDACGEAISLAAQSILIRDDLSRGKAFLETSRQYATSVLVGGTIINCFPPALRWLVAPLVALRTKYFQSHLVKMLVPVIQDRISQGQPTAQGEPGDFLDWMLPQCSKEGAHELDPTRIALRMVSLLAPFIFGTSYVFTHCILNIYGSASREAFLSGLEEECIRVSGLNAGLATSESVAALFRADSALRESMRVSDVAITNLFRDVTAGELDLGHGLRVGPGTRLVFPTQAVHLDPDNYENPTQYDAFRFSRPFEGTSTHDGTERELVVTTTPTFLPFGYGRHACPGRWFVAQLMKQALAHVVLNYDLELVGASTKRTALLNTMLPPLKAQIKIRRKTIKL